MEGSLRGLLLRHWRKPRETPVSTGGIGPEIWIRHLARTHDPRAYTHEAAAHLWVSLNEMRAMQAECWIAASCRPGENRMCCAKSARVDGRNKVTIKRILAEQGQETRRCYPWLCLVPLEQPGSCEGLPDVARTKPATSFPTSSQTWVYQDALKTTFRR